MRTSTIKMSVKQWAEEDRPSMKLLNLGANTLTNAELISILVGSGLPAAAGRKGKVPMKTDDHSDLPSIFAK